MYVTVYPNKVNISSENCVFIVVTLLCICEVGKLSDHSAVVLSRRHCRDVAGGLPPCNMTLEGI